MKHLHFPMATVLSLAALTASAVAQPRIEAGVLRCRGGETMSFIIGSEHHINCIFRTSFGDRQRYTGVIRKLGVDIGISKRSRMVWTVLAPTRRVGAGELAGNYGGVSAGAAVGVGGSANILLGGSNNSFALQPLSLQGDVGLNVSATVTGLELRSR